MVEAKTLLLSPVKKAEGVGCGCCISVRQEPVSGSAWYCQKDVLPLARATDGLPPVIGPHFKSVFRYDCPWSGWPITKGAVRSNLIDTLFAMPQSVP